MLPRALTRVGGGRWLLGVRPHAAAALMAPRCTAPALAPPAATPAAPPLRRLSALVVTAGMAPTDVELPRHRVTASFSRSSGAGGQNVNKLNTKAELRFAIGEADWLDAHTAGRLRELFSNAVTRDDELLVTSQRHRTQEANLEDAFDKLTAMVAEAAQVPKERALRTGVTADTKERWREDKRHRKELKERRRGARFGAASSLDD